MGCSVAECPITGDGQSRGCPLFSMIWKTRGTVRREAQGEKKVKCYLEFPLTCEDVINGTIHKVRECDAINAITLVKSISLWETEISEPEICSQKIGRGAWVQVRRSTLCPLCFEEKTQKKGD